MKHNILKIFFISLILLLGVSNAWAKRFYFEVPSHWERTENTVFKLRLYTGEDHPNGWSKPLQKVEGSSNIYYYDNSTYTHVQFCQMKEGMENEIYLQNTKYNTTKTEFPQTEKNLLKVTSTVQAQDNKDNYIQYIVGEWDYNIFTAQNVHFIFQNMQQQWRNPKLLIGTKTRYTIYDLAKVTNSIALHHLHINELQFIGYTIINSNEQTGEFEGSFLEKIAQYTQDNRTKIYYEPLTGNVFHIFSINEDHKRSISNINYLNTTLTIRCEVSYDGGVTYESTGTLPVNITTTTKYFGENWDNMDQEGTITLTKGSNIFQASTTLGFENLIYLSANDCNTDLYKVVGWKKGDVIQSYNPRPYRRTGLDEETDFVLLLERINPNQPCAVTFVLEDNNIPSQVVAPNTRAQKPVIESIVPGKICKWYSDGSYQNEFNFDTHIIEDITLYGAWVPEAEVGDYRLLYVEQVVEKSSVDGEEWKTVITRKKAHPSDIIKKRTETETDIVSLHVYNKNTYQAIKRYIGEEPDYYDSPSNSAVVLQRYDGAKWVDIEHHMVFGPLAAVPEVGMLPGRRNVGEDINLIDKLEADPGIFNNDIVEELVANHRYKGNGVWNFPIKQTVNGSNVTAELVREDVVPYKGTYYIRTANAKGGWNNYKNNSDNHMTKSEYQTSLKVENEEFTQYNCKRVKLDERDSKFVHFVVANDYAQAISDTLIADRADILGNALSQEQIIVGDNAELPANSDVNIRFSWKEENNALHRAYISHAEADNANFLLLNDKASANTLFNLNKDNNGNPVALTNKQQLFTYNDHNHYQTNLRAKTNAPVTLTATYADKTQDLKGTTVTPFTLFEGNAEDQDVYPIHALYNFGENQLSTFYLPIGDEFANKDMAIETDVMIVRKNHEQANQLLLTKNARTINTGKTAYGALTFTYEHLSSNSWAAANDKTFYWISFPFDVQLSDVFGFGKYAVHWYIEYYDGAERAEKGLFLDSGTYWKYVTKKEASTFELKANTGYVLWLNVPRIQSDGLLNNYNAQEITLFFPSMNPIQKQFGQETNVMHDLEPHICNIERRKNEDSNWHLIGVPSYANTTETTQTSNTEFVYDYLPATDTYEAVSSSMINNREGGFRSMYAYMVQFAGTINWSTVIRENTPASLAARKETSDNEERQLRLELRQNNVYADQTFVHLQNNEATTAFDMNRDLTKIINAGANIYSITSDNVDVAGNIIPMEEATLMLGVELQTAGEYTFAMPEGTEGMVVELIDYETNTRTNLLLDNYTVTLSTGINETRFALSIRPDKTATSVENIGDEATGAKKYIIDGQLYLQKDGTVYDAQGRSL